MKIEYTGEIKFSQEQLQKLFLSVKWDSGKHPGRLFKAMEKSDKVISAWMFKFMICF